MNARRINPFDDDFGEVEEYFTQRQKSEKSVSIDECFSELGNVGLSVMHTDDIIFAESTEQVEKKKQESARTSVLLRSQSVPRSLPLSRIYHPSAQKPNGHAGTLDGSQARGEKSMKDTFNGPKNNTYTFHSTGNSTNRNVSPEKRTMSPSRGHSLYDRGMRQMRSLEQRRMEATSKPESTSPIKGPNACAALGKNGTPSIKKAGNSSSVKPITPKLADGVSKNQCKDSQKQLYEKSKSSKTSPMKLSRAEERELSSANATFTARSSGVCERNA